jgi:delta 1-pyrroline-5-carboxylate dehydrogenase
MSENAAVESSERERARIDANIIAKMPKMRDLYYDGGWRKPGGGYASTYNPATGADLGPCAEANAQDVEAAVSAAKRAYPTWRSMKPHTRAEFGKSLGFFVIMLKSSLLSMLRTAEIQSTKW